MFKLPNWKQIVWIVVFATASVLLRHSEILTANWMWWVLAFVFVIIYELLSTRADSGDETPN